MEIKIIADKKLLDAIDKLAEAMKALQLPQIDAVTALPVTDEEEPAQSEKAVSGENKAISEAVHEEPVKEPVKEPEQEAPAVPTREEVQRIAVAKIQAKLGKQVKVLIEKHGGTRVSDVPEASLAAFKADLEQL